MPALSRKITLNHKRHINNTGTDTAHYSHNSNSSQLVPQNQQQALLARVAPAIVEATRPPRPQPFIVIGIPAVFPLASDAVTPFSFSAAANGDGRSGGGGGSGVTHLLFKSAEDIACAVASTDGDRDKGSKDSKGGGFTANGSGGGDSLTSIIGFNRTAGESDGSHKNISSSSSSCIADSRHILRWTPPADTTHCSSCQTHSNNKTSNGVVGGGRRGAEETHAPSPTGEEEVTGVFAGISLRHCRPSPTSVAPITNSNSNSSRVGCNNGSSTTTTANATPAAANGVSVTGQLRELRSSTGGGGVWNGGGGGGGGQGALHRHSNNHHGVGNASATAASRYDRWHGGPNSSGHHHDHHNNDDEEEEGAGGAAGGGRATTATATTTATSQFLRRSAVQSRGNRNHNNASIEEVEEEEAAAATTDGGAYRPFTSSAHYVKPSSTEVTDDRQMQLWFDESASAVAGGDDATIIPFTSTSSSACCGKCGGSSSRGAHEDKEKDNVTETVGYRVSLPAFLHCQQLPPAVEGQLVAQLCSHVDGWLAASSSFGKNNKNASVHPRRQRCSFPPSSPPPPPPFWIAAFTHTPRIHSRVASYAADKIYQQQQQQEKEVCCPSSNNINIRVVPSSLLSGAAAAVVVVPWPAWVPPLSISLNILCCLHRTALVLVDDIAAAMEASATASVGSDAFVGFTDAVFGKKATTRVMRLFFRQLALRPPTQQAMLDAAYEYPPKQQQQSTTWMVSNRVVPPVFSTSGVGVGGGGGGGGADTTTTTATEADRVLASCTFPSCCLSEEEESHRQRQRRLKRGRRGDTGTATASDKSNNTNSGHSAPPQSQLQQQQQEYYPSLLETFHFFALTWASRPPLLAMVGGPLQDFIHAHGPVSRIIALEKDADATTTTNTGCDEECHDEKKDGGGGGGGGVCGVFQVQSALCAFAEHWGTWRLWWSIGSQQQQQHQSSASGGGGVVARLLFPLAATPPGQKTNHNTALTATTTTTAPTVLFFRPTSAALLSERMGVTANYAATQCLRWFLFDANTHNNGNGSDAGVMLPLPSSPFPSSPPSEEVFAIWLVADGNALALGLNLLPPLLRSFLLRREVTSLLGRALGELQESGGGGGGSEAGINQTATSHDGYQQQQQQQRALRYFMAVLCWCTFDGDSSSSTATGSGGGVGVGSVCDGRDDDDDGNHSAQFRHWEAVWQQWLLPFFALHWHASWWWGCDGAGTVGCHQLNQQHQHQEQQQQQSAEVLFLSSAHSAVTAVAEYYFSHVRRLIRLVRKQQQQQQSGSSSRPHNNTNSKKEVSRLERHARLSSGDGGVSANPWHRLSTASTAAPLSLFSEHGYDEEGDGDAMSNNDSDSVGGGGGGGGGSDFLSECLVTGHVTAGAVTDHHHNSGCSTRGRHCSPSSAASAGNDGASTALSFLPYPLPGSNNTINTRLSPTAPTTTTTTKATDRLLKSFCARNSASIATGCGIGPAASDAPWLTGHAGRVSRTNLRQIRAALSALAAHSVYASRLATATATSKNNSSDVTSWAASVSAGHLSSLPPPVITAAAIEQNEQQHLMSESAECAAAAATSSHDEVMRQYQYLYGVLPPWVFQGGDTNNKGIISIMQYSDSDSDVNDDDDDDNSNCSSSAATPSTAQDGSGGRVMHGEKMKTKTKKKRRMDSTQRPSSSCSSPASSSSPSPSSQQQQQQQLHTPHGKKLKRKRNATAATADAASSVMATPDGTGGHDGPSLAHRKRGRNPRNNSTSSTGGRMSDVWREGRRRGGRADQADEDDEDGDEYEKESDPLFVERNLFETPVTAPPSPGGDSRTSSSSSSSPSAWVDVSPMSNASHAADDSGG